MSSKEKQAVVAIGKILQEGKGKDVVAFDITGKNSWADYFIIATVSSATQANGLYKQVMDSTKALEIEVYPVKKRNSEKNDWILIDLGNIIVHLMSETAREFYDLERLWFGAENLLA